MPLFKSISKDQKQREWYSAWISVIPTTIGFFMGFFVNSLIDNQKERESYSSMVQAIKIEAEINRDIIDNSFIPNYNNDNNRNIVLRELNTKVSQGYLQDRVFLQFTSENDLKVITKYISSLSRINGFRDLFLNIDKYKLTDSVIKLQKMAWGNYLDTAARNIGQVSLIGKGI